MSELELLVNRDELEALHDGLLFELQHSHYGEERLPHFVSARHKVSKLLGYGTIEN